MSARSSTPSSAPSVAPSSAPSLVVEHLSKSFGDSRAVRDASFEVHAGEIFGLLGPNGAGKTTTIRMMLDIFRPDSGRVEILGSTPEKVPKDRIGYLPEERGLYKDVPLEQVLVFLATLKGLREAEAKRRLVPWLKRMDLLEERHKKVQELSKGMQQKAQVIATLLHEPDLIVVDEPFAGLDPVNTRLIKNIIREQVKAGRTVIMSTHQMYQVEELCHRIVLIDHGRTVLYGPVEQIRRDFAANAVLLEGEGDFSGLPEVLEARQENGVWRLALMPGADPQDVLRALVTRPGVRLDRFERAEPSLDDIFVTVVTGRGKRRGRSRDGDGRDAPPGGRAAAKGAPKGGARTSSKPTRQGPAGTSGRAASGRAASGEAAAKGAPKGDDRDNHDDGRPRGDGA